MDGFAAIVRLVTALLTASAGPGASPTDPAADLRLPLLNEAAAVSEPDELSGVVRFQAGEEEPLDADLGDDLGGDEFTDEEPLDADLEGDVIEDDFVDEEPLDDELVTGEPFAGDEVVDQPPSDLPPVATTPSSNRTATLPPGFGAGQTVVVNPPAGETAEIPEDCKGLVQNGRAVVGTGCGAGSADGAPWWASQVGLMPPPASATSGQRVSRPSGFPFDDDFPFGDDDAIIIAGRSTPVGREPLRTVTHGGETEILRDDDSVSRLNLVPPEPRLQLDDDRRTGADLASRLERIAEIRTSPADRSESAARQQRVAQRAAKGERAARSERGAKAKAKLNPCQAAKQIAKNPKSAKQLERAKAKCQQFKKAKKQARNR